MKKLQRLIAPEPLHLPAEAMAELQELACEFLQYEDIPQDDEEILRRIQDADGVLLNLYTPLRENVLRKCPRLRYIGLACSLYEDESCTCHLPTVRDMGIAITGVSDYGDNGVAEFAISRLVDLLHGFSGPMWKSEPHELTGERIGVLGFGATGSLVAKALLYFGADVSYHCRSEKPEANALGLTYRSLPDILEHCDILCTCLNKNVTLLTAEHLRQWTGNKIILNTSLSPSFDPDAIRFWLDEGNHLICDSPMALGNPALLSHPSVSCAGKFSGGGFQCNQRLGQGVVRNLRRFLDEIEL